ncbi:hypothetical protein GPJ56_002489 [Histomonas meleagridis]|uniref:uncharacterized protein n=1 Tax=Histomonas meleagridis TaxID=135588 RepID=UPI0035596194|nr:hypothetical protein GPJ56_002489 [Histomonas meleagridis]KAH0801790.1 hypothetical protein GO595_005471 [Histomonas meleagridis]
MCSKNRVNDCDKFIEEVKKIYSEDCIYKVLTEAVYGSSIPHLYAFSNWNNGDSDINAEMFALFKNLALKFSESSRKNTLPVPSIRADFSRYDLGNIICMSGDKSATFILTENHLCYQKTDELWFPLPQQINERPTQIRCNYNGTRVIIVSQFAVWLINGLPNTVTFHNIEYSNFSDDSPLRDIHFIGESTALFVYESHLSFIDLTTMLESSDIPKYSENHTFISLKLLKNDSSEDFYGAFLATQREFYFFHYSNGVFNEKSIILIGGANELLCDFDFYDEEHLICVFNSNIYYCPIKLTAIFQYEKRLSVKMTKIENTFDSIDSKFEYQWDKNNASQITLTRSGDDFYVLVTMYPRSELYGLRYSNDTFQLFKLIVSNDIIGYGGNPSVCIISPGYVVPFASHSVSEIFEIPNLFTRVDPREEFDVKELAELQEKLKGLEKFLSEVKAKKNINVEVDKIEQDESFGEWEEAKQMLMRCKEAMKRIVEEKLEENEQMESESDDENEKSLIFEEFAKVIE